MFKINWPDYMIRKGVNQVSNNKKEKMKKLIIRHANKIALTFMFSMVQLLAMAQDSTGGSSSITKESTTTTTTTSEWYTQPWVWIVGAAVLIVIIVALMRGNSTKEVTRTTVIKDDRL